MLHRYINITKKGEIEIMEKASRVMYSIANFFTWIIAILSIVGIVFSVLSLCKVITGFADNTTCVFYIVYLSIALIIALITIAMVRRAKAKGSSKAWDVLFLILGILGSNIFYILGGIFGIVANRD